MIDPFVVAGLFGYSAAKDLIGAALKRIRSRNRTAYQEAADTFALILRDVPSRGSFIKTLRKGLRPYRLDFPDTGCEPRDRDIDSGAVSWIGPSPKQH